MENKNITINELVQTKEWKNFMSKLELFSAILLGIVILLIITGFSNSKYFGFFLSLSLINLSSTSFFISFQKLESDSKILSFLFYRIYGIGLSMGFITILFISMNWPIAKEFFIIVSTFLIAISSCLGVREMNTENKNGINRIYFLRIIVALVPLIYMIFQNIILKK